MVAFGKTNSLHFFADGEEGFDANVLVSVETLAKKLELSKRTIWRMASAGRLPHPVKVGGSTRWRMSEINTWIEGGCESIN